ncbi:MAG: hypothetical protein HC939_17445 [Pleurocapsa sp. SU_5_0]|nr:hypothetical protein [Pleurocapsa sp. SU_5_0]
MSNLDRVLDEAMNLPTEQQEMLIQILQRRAIEQRRDQIAHDAQLSLAEFREGKLKIQTAEEAIADLRGFIQND